MKINGKEYAWYKSAFNDEDYSSRIAGRRGASPIPTGKSKVASLEAVVDLIQDRDVISYPHYYRFGDKGLEMVIKTLQKKKKKGVILYANAVFDHTDPWLFEAFQDGTLAGLYGNIYRKFGVHVMEGELLPWVTVGFSHGNRVRKLQTGEVRVKAAFAPVPLADQYGNATGLTGPQEQLCGPLGLAAADWEFADYTCLLAGEISSKLIVPFSLSMKQTDFVVPVECPGLSSGIGSGTLDLEKVRSQPLNTRIAGNVLRVMKAADVVRDQFSFQVGAGAGLIVLDSIRTMLKDAGIQAGFSIGGVTSMHVDMLEEGSIRHLLHGQLFEPSPKVIHSLKESSAHMEITAGYYASVANKECAVNLLDLAVLSALEVDLDFNVNTVCANGRIIGGIGGGQDVAAGAGLTIIFLPLATGKKGLAFPKIQDKVYTRTTPGDVIDVVVTEEFAAVNPHSTSPCQDAILENGKKFGLQLLSIEELRQKALDAAQNIGKIPPRPETAGDILHAVEWRDGTLLDVIRKTASA
jgi:citrate lyase subunit alpha / citrate CoA-transferase